jgi:hypothetical protein
MTWLLSRIFPHYWEVSSFGQTPVWTTHFLTKKEAYEYANTHKGCVVDYYINARPWYLIRVSKEHKAFYPIR